MIKQVALLGNGCRGNTELIDKLTKNNIVLLTTWMGCDLIPEDHPNFCGRPGILGQRAANIIQQKADILYVFGARLDGDQTAYNYDKFAPNAQVTVVDVDVNELSKYPTRWSVINRDVKDLRYDFLIGDPAWLMWCKYLHNDFDRIRKFDVNTNYVDPFSVSSWLSEIGTSNDIFAIGSSGQAPCTFYQSFRVKEGQRVMNCSTIGAMGADIPMAIGTAIGNPDKRIICVTGDGGFALNIQELELVHALNLNIKFFVYNNLGYGSIRNMQAKRFNENYVAESRSSWLQLPRIRNVAETFNIKYIPCVANDSLDEYLNLHTKENYPIIVDVLIDPDFVQYPRVDSTMKPDGTFELDNMEDMTPKLDRKELKELMEWNG